MPRARASAEPPGPETVPMDGQARVALAHACIEALARREGVDLLHVKGPALDLSLRGEERLSSDADVLVRPSHVRRLTAALGATGWRLVTDFHNGSVFEHAANHHHLDWGYVDVHRSFPGITREAEVAFDALWADRGSTAVAHVDCVVPAVVDQALLLCLHAARGFDGLRAREDLDHAWHAGTDESRSAIRGRAADLGAEVALAAALGELDRYDDRTVDLWRYYSRGGSRLDEFQARLRAAPTRRAKARVAVRGLGVNREFAAMMLGHEPSRSEMVGLFFGRFVTAGREGVRRLRPGGRPTDDA